MRSSTKTSRNPAKRSSRSTATPKARNLTTAERTLATRMLEAAGVEIPRNPDQRRRLMVRAVTVADLLTFSADLFALDAAKLSDVRDALPAG